jgi:pyruvate dehydrogenase E1 component alpha subunit
LFRKNPTKFDELFQIMDKNAKIIAPDSMPKFDNSELLSAYRHLLRARLVDDKAMSYQRQKKIHTLPINKGQEACAVGSSMALRKTDWLVQSYRELGGLLYRGMEIKDYYLYFKGGEWGAAYPKEMRTAPVSVPIGSQILHGAGIGHAITYQKTDDVVIVHFGDGATSQGDFHEALNWASVFSCPVIFFCNNNQYAISHKREFQCKAETLAQKALSYDMAGIQVDGNDFFAVYKATSEAAAYCRAGNGPVLIESVTYRMGPHTTSDDPSLYRSKEEEESWADKDPILRMFKFLKKKKIWNDKKDAALRDEILVEIDLAMKEVEKINSAPLAETFAYMYSDTPADLNDQQREYEAFLKWKELR